LSLHQTRRSVCCGKQGSQKGGFDGHSTGVHHGLDQVVDVVRPPLIKTVPPFNQNRATVHDPACRSTRGHSQCHRLPGMSFKGARPRTPCLLTHLRSLWPHVPRVLRSCSTPFFPLCIRFVLTCVCRHFGNNKLKGTLPATLSRLRSLTEFKCGINNLEGKIPSLLEFASVHELEFGSNKFTGAFPAEMVELTSLVSFIVSKNALTGTLPSNFNKLQKLEVFAASSNKLSSMLPESFASLPKLQELDLSSNYLTGVVHRELVSHVAARPGWYG
jgi:hypothetical protein